MAKKPEREIERWVTWHGARIPIFKGESNDDVRERMRQRAQKGKENRPVTKEGEENLRRKAADAERKAMYAIEDEKANPTERRKRLADKANKEADNAWSKYNKVWNKKEDGKRINKVKFNKQTKADEKVKSKDEGIYESARKAGKMSEQSAESLEKRRDWLMTQNPTPENATEYMAINKELKSRNRVDEESLRNYGYDPRDATGDPTVINADGKSYYKIGEDKWKEHSSSGRVLSSSISSKQLADKLANAKDVKVMPSEKNNTSTSKSEMSIDPVSGLLKKSDIDIGGSKYNAQEQVDAINYMYGYDSLPKARKAILEGKHSEDDIKRALLYHELDGLPYKEKKKAYEQSLKTHGLEKKSEKSWQDKDEEVKAKQIANSEQQKAERNGWKAPSKNKLIYDSPMYEDVHGNLGGKPGKKYTEAEIEEQFKKFGFGEDGDNNWDEWVKDTQLKETANMSPRIYKINEGKKRFWQGDERVNVRKDGMGRLEKTGKYNPDKMGFDAIQSKREKIFNYASDIGMDPSIAPKELMHRIQKKFKLTPKQAKMAMMNILGWEEEDLR